MCALDPLASLNKPKKDSNPAVERQSICNMVHKWYTEPSSCESCQSFFFQSSTQCQKQFLSDQIDFLVETVAPAVKLERPYKIRETCHLHSYLANKNVQHNVLHILAAQEYWRDFLANSGVCLGQRLDEIVIIIVVWKLREEWRFDCALLKIYLCGDFQLLLLIYASVETTRTLVMRFSDVFPRITALRPFSKLLSGKIVYYSIQTGLAARKVRLQLKGLTKISNWTSSQKMSASAERTN